MSCGMPTRARFSITLTAGSDEAALERRLLMATITVSSKEPGKWQINVPGLEVVSDENLREFFQGTPAILTAFQRGGGGECGEWFFKRQE